MDPTIDKWCRVAVRCNECFEGELHIQRTRVDIAQPRWIGPRYQISRPRVLIVLTNPGSGIARHSTADLTFRQELVDYQQGNADLRPVLDHQRADMPNWGGLQSFYMEGFGLNLDETAFINIAWCASISNAKGKNAYPPEMLDRCFGRFTAPVVQALNPELFILGGGAAQKFATRLRVIVPAAEFVNVLHYSHRPRDLPKRPGQIGHVRAVLARLRFNG